MDLHQFQAGLAKLNFKGTQSLVSPGSASEFVGSILPNQLDEIVFLTVDVNRRFMIIDPDDSGWQCFCIMRTGESWYHGARSQGGDICGYSAKRLDTACHWEGMMQLILLPHGLMEERLLRVGAEMAVNRIQNTNAIRVNDGMFDTFSRLQQEGCLGTLRSKEQIYDMITVALSVGTDDPDRVISKNWELAWNAAKQIHEEVKGEAITIPDLKRALFASESSLNAASKHNFGVTIGRLIECFRLAQAHIELLKADPKEGQVQEVMDDYGFGNNGRFASKHRELFAMHPAEALAGERFDQLELFGAGQAAA